MARFRVSRAKWIRHALLLVAVGGLVVSVGAPPSALGLGQERVPQAVFGARVELVQIQVQVEGSWGHRWGFDAEKKYNGYSWKMEGTTTGVRSGKWVKQRLDLIKQLKINPGKLITGLAFSSNDRKIRLNSPHPTSRKEKKKQKKDK